MPPNKNSVLIFFMTGFLLLIIPLVLMLFWNEIGCATEVLGHSTLSSYCPSIGIFKSADSFFPFLMVIGGVLVGYNLKRISDSFLPPPEDDEEISKEDGENEAKQAEK